MEQFISLDEVREALRERREQVAELERLERAIQNFRLQKPAARKITSKAAPKRAPAMPRGKAPNTTGMRDAILRLPLPPQFTRVEVESCLKARTFNFGQRKPSDAIRDALYAMLKDGLIRLVKKFDGENLNTYERVNLSGK